MTNAESDTMGVVRLNAALTNAKAQIEKLETELETARAEKAFAESHTTALTKECDRLKMECSRLEMDACAIKSNYAAISRALQTLLGYCQKFLELTDSQGINFNSEQIAALQCIAGAVFAQE